MAHRFLSYRGAQFTSRLFGSGMTARLSKGRSVHERMAARPVASSYNALRTMQANRSTSMLEKRFRKLLWRLGLRYRLSLELPGRPDIVFPRQRLVVFVHGCFWHRCPTCRLPSPNSNRTFWEEKLARNRERDATAIRTLESMGWTAEVIWECEIRSDTPGMANRVVNLLSQSKSWGRQRPSG